MARAALNWGVRELAIAARMSSDTVSRFERGEALKPRSVASLASAFEDASIEFLPENGVRLKAEQQPQAAHSSWGGSRKQSGESRHTGVSADSGPAPRPRKPERKAEPPRSKLEQIRALREQASR